MKIVLFFTISLLFSRISAQIQADSITSNFQSFDLGEKGIYGYEKPTLWQVLKYIPDDLYSFGKFTVQKENLVWDGIVVGSTAALIPLDQQLLDSSVEIGEKMGGGWNKDSQYGKFLGLNIIPKNISSGVYYIGNGGTTVLLSGVFYGIGKINNDYRALNTANELMEALISTGIATQTIKRITGRQSPVRALRDGNDGGDWTFFPSFTAYQRDTPNYDAMPSGHLATFMATITIIGTNYPEIGWIKPVGYALTVVLAFNMVSTKVHWVSDYPLGILMGYVIGKRIATRRIQKTESHSVREKSSKIKWNFSTSRFADTSLYGLTMTF